MDEDIILHHAAAKDFLRKLASATAGIYVQQPYQQVISLLDAGKSLWMARMSGAIEVYPTLNGAKIVATSPEWLDQVRAALGE